MAGSGFETFETSHLVVIGLTALAPALLSLAARKELFGAADVWIARGLALVLLLNELVRLGVELAADDLLTFARASLPLHPCGISAFATSMALLTRSQAAFEICYFWGFVGASNAVLTPGDLGAGFPGYRFFQYFVTHSGIVTGALYATWGLRMRPTWRGMLRAFAWANLFAAALALFNLALGSNYMYLSAPPPGTVSPFFFAPWPWYILIIEFIAFAFFVAVYAPFPLAAGLANRARKLR